MELYLRTIIVRGVMEGVVVRLLAVTCTRLRKTRPSMMFKPWIKAAAEILAYGSRTRALSGGPVECFSSKHTSTRYMALDCTIAEVGPATEEEATVLWRRPLAVKDKER